MKSNNTIKKIENIIFSLREDFPRPALYRHLLFITKFLSFASLSIKLVLTMLDINHILFIKF